MWSIFWYALISAFVIDQLTKFIVVKSKFHYFKNVHGPLGLYKHYPYFRPIIWSLHLTIIISLFFTSNAYIFLGASLISAQISNIVDRITYKGVIDFIPFPTPLPNLRIAYFNFADICILIGDIIYLKGLFTFPFAFFTS